MLFNWFELSDRENLEAHHMDSWMTTPEKRYLVGNGVLLHKTVHTDFHAQYGNETTVSHFELYCKQKYNITKFPWSSDKNFIEQNKANIICKKENRLKELQFKLMTAGLKLVSGVYENKHSKIVIYCPKHNYTHETTIHNFKRSIYGIPCCAKEQSNKQKNKRRL